jgi:2-polyprenyl-3-methyl-5-hydroxy-6-metoxy-1,4-benzoquinol methylase
MFRRVRLEGLYGGDGLNLLLCAWQHKERAVTHASYNDIAQWYDQFLRERPVYTEVLLPNLLRLIGAVKGEVICDLACGQGWVARELARGGAQVTGLDLAPNLLALARGY